jgi:hypothetical protein
VLIPLLDPQHPQHAGKYEVKLMSNPQQKPQQAQHRAATLEALSIEVLTTTHTQAQSQNEPNYGLTLG